MLPTAKLIMIRPYLARKLPTPGQFCVHFYVEDIVAAVLYFRRTDKKI